MYYRIKDNKIYDYADYEYAKDCLCTNVCTMKAFAENPDDYIIDDGQIIPAPNLDEIKVQRKKEQFEKAFFYTSLGWIKRKVTMQDGSVKDFLADLLLAVKAGIEMGQEVEIITYKTPDYTEDMSKEYLESLQELKFATSDFIRECLFQTVKDFRGEIPGGENGI